MLADPRVRARIAAGTALVALVALVGSLWPDAGIAAWPAAALGLGAMALAASPGPIRPRAFATVAGAGAAVLGWLQIGVLWLAATALGGVAP